MKNICFFSGDITNSGGTERVSIQIASNLARQKEKYHISFISLTERQSSTFFPMDDKIIRHKLFDQKVSGIKHFVPIVYKLLNFVKKNKIDILIDIDGILDMFSLTVKLFSPVKVISWEHFNYYETLGNHFRMSVRKLAANFADSIVTLTDEDKGYYQNNLKIKHRIEHIYNPIELSESNNNFDVTSRIIVSAGRLTSQKGFDLLLDVAKLVFEKHKDWKWLVLGDGEDRKMIEDKIKEYNLNGNVILTGRVSNVDEYYEKSAMYVMTSRFEGFPLVLIEAKANHLPVVSFKCRTGPSEMVKDGVNGYLVECFDVDDMAEKISYLIENDEARKVFSENALLDTEKLDLRNITTQWVELLDEL